MESNKRETPDTVIIILIILMCLLATAGVYEMTRPSPYKTAKVTDIEWADTLGGNLPHEVTLVFEDGAQRQYCVSTITARMFFASKNNNIYERPVRVPIKKSLFSSVLYSGDADFYQMQVKSMDDTTWIPISEMDYTIAVE